MLLQFFTKGFSNTITVYLKMCYFVVLKRSMFLVTIAEKPELQVRVTYTNEVLVCLKTYPTQNTQKLDTTT